MLKWFIVVIVVIIIKIIIIIIMRHLFHILISKITPLRSTPKSLSCQILVTSLQSATYPISPKPESSKQPVGR